MWTAEAPSNLALIKYIGKVENPKQEFFFKNSVLEKYKLNQNVPLNTSLSLTLNHFRTKIELKESQSDELEFKFLKGERDISLDDKKKFLNFFNFLKNILHIPNYYKITSQNNFPHSSGVASSSSSFAALTLATYNLAKDCSQNFKPLHQKTLAQLSSLGSGSSSRSFFSLGAVWEPQKGISPFNSFPWSPLTHELIVVGLNLKKSAVHSPSRDLSLKSETLPVKEISSSKAHQFVKTSSFFKERPLRAEERFCKIKEIFKSKDWKKTYEIVKDEFLDMHQLFHTSSPSFSYQTPESKIILEQLFQFWKDRENGPLITMDAGPHIHLLYRSDQKELAREIQSYISPSLFVSSGF